MRVVFLGSLIILALLGGWLWLGQSNEENLKANNVAPDSVTGQAPTVHNALAAPMERLSERRIIKPFGIFITPDNSPVLPERFSGYHTGVDFEILAGEENLGVTVLAICDGELLVKRWAGGYGGVAVQACQINNEPVTVIYGHVALESIKYDVGDRISRGATLGMLAQPGPATDNERQHLHLGIHKGSEVNLLGYVPSQSQLESWINPQLTFMY